jgi:hypothetical protein
MGLYDYECKKGHITEKKADRNLQHIICPDCGEVATRLAVPARPPMVIGDTCVRPRYQNALHDKASG